METQKTQMENPTKTGGNGNGENALTMTSREIAEVTGKQHGNVMRDIRSMMDALSMDSNLNPCSKPTTYRGKDGRMYDQYELDKDTCLTLLLGYDPVARMKVVKRWQELEAARAAAAPQIRDPRIAAMVLALKELDAVKQEQEKQSRDIAGLQEGLAVIEARTQPECRHFTVMGWARLNGQSLPLNGASALGRRCAVLSRQRGLPIGDVSDPRFGKVHSYHESVLREAFRGSTNSQYTTNHRNT